MNKKVCIIRSNPVKPDSRVEKEALSLCKAGYTVMILAWDRDSNHKLKKDVLNIGGKEIEIIRLGYKATFGEGFKNIIPYLKFQFSIRRFLKKNSFDIVHACDFDTAFFSYRLVKRKKQKFVFDIFDFLYGDPKGLLQKIVKKAQIKIINKADATIICTEERIKQIEGALPKKLTVIHNTPSPEQLPSFLKKEKQINNKPRVCYVGILQKGRLLKEIGEYFRNNQDLEFHIGGFGYLEEYFDQLGKEYENIHYYGRIPYEKTLELENNCDIMLAIYDPKVENHRFAAPNKFYESLMLGKPVIMVKGTGMSNVVEENKIGVLIEYSLQGFAEGINKLISQIESWSTMGQRMVNIYQESYSWDEMERRLLQLYKEL